MKSIFASNRGKKARAVIFAVIVFAVISFLYNNLAGGGSSDDSTTVTAESSEDPSSTPQIGSFNIYDTKPSDGGGDQQAPDETAPDNSEKANAEELKNQVRTAGSDFTKSMTTYDFNNPPAYASIPGMPKDAANAKTVKPKFNEFVAGIKQRKELSTGQVQKVTIKSMKYHGTPTYGDGTAVVVVQVSQTISGETAGGAGNQAIKTYTVTLNRNQNNTQDGVNWFVTDYSVA